MDDLKLVEFDRSRFDPEGIANFDLRTHLEEALADLKYQGFSVNSSATGFKVRFTRNRPGKPKKIEFNVMTPGKSVQAYWETFALSAVKFLKHEFGETSRRGFTWDVWPKNSIWKKSHLEMTGSEMSYGTSFDKVLAFWLKETGSWPEIEKSLRLILDSNDLETKKRQKNINNTKSKLKPVLRILFSQGLTRQDITDIVNETIVSLIHET